jgi:two-component sensor histidine kinase/CheY-like chemotaxis protein
VTSPAGEQRPRLLYIDDDEGLRRLVRRALDRRGYEVTTAGDGVEGVAAAAASATPFDVVAVDHYMPGQDGLATLQQLRALPEPPPVVYVTGSDESRIAVAALKAGAADYVVKSGADDFQDLLANAIGQAVAQARLRRERDAAEHALSEANARLEAVVARQAVLLREVNHRVANSLQMIASMVHMQSAAVDDPAARTALRDTEARIAAIMQVHRRLYTSDDVQNVDMQEYLGGLVAELESSLAAGGQARSIRLTAQPVRLNTDKAVSLGVVVAELVTNAFKYAYPVGREGEVRVDLQAEAAHAIRLVVEDDGRGMGDQAPKGTGLGQRVIAAMARSLGSEVTYDPAHRGARAVLAFQA